MIHHIKPCRHMFVAREAGEDAFELTADLGGQSRSSKVPCAWKSYYSSCHPIIAGISSSSSTESYLQPPLSPSKVFSGVRCHWQALVLQWRTLSLSWLRSLPRLRSISLLITMASSTSGRSRITAETYSCVVQSAAVSYPGALTC